MNRALKELVCFHTRVNFMEDVLGVGVIVKRLKYVIFNKFYYLFFYLLIYLGMEALIRLVVHLICYLEVHSLMEFALQ